MCFPLLPSTFTPWKQKPKLQCNVDYETPCNEAELKAVILQLDNYTHTTSTNCSCNDGASTENLRFDS